MNMLDDLTHKLSSNAAYVVEHAKAQISPLRTFIRVTAVTNTAPVMK